MVGHWVEFITKEMLDEANHLLPHLDFGEEYRTSRHDKLIGALGEFVLAQFIYHDWRKHNLPHNAGDFDFPDVHGTSWEAKASFTPLNEKFHLLVPEDYAVKRSPDKYVLVILHKSHGQTDVRVGNTAHLYGWATSPEVLAGELWTPHTQPFRNIKRNVYAVHCTELRSMRELRP